jgi:hypothetical protein
MAAICAHAKAGFGPAALRRMLNVLVLGVGIGAGVVGPLGLGVSGLDGSAMYLSFDSVLMSAALALNTIVALSSVAALKLAGREMACTF